MGLPGNGTIPAPYTGERRLLAKQAGAEISLVRFVRFETGEGLEKKNEDFAAEVAAQMK